MTCNVVCIILRTCHTKHQSQLLLLSTIVLKSYCSFNINFDSYNFSHKNSLFFETDNIHCMCYGANN